MSQAPMSIANESGASFRSDANNIFAALYSSNSGPTAPSGTAPVVGTPWIDSSGTPNILKLYDGSSWVAIGTIDATNHLFTAYGSNQNSRTVSQSSHGFAVGNVLKLSASNTYAKAKADSLADISFVGIVSAVIDANNFQLTTSGYMTGLTSLTAGSIYYVDATTAGSYTATPPATWVGSCFIAINATSIFVLPFNIQPAAMVGDSGSGGKAGIVPAPSIGDAVKALFGDATYKSVFRTVKYQKFTGAGTYTYTPSTGMMYAFMRGCGGGGGSGGMAGAASGGGGTGGGGGGETAQLLTTAAAIGASKTVTIGAGGANGASGNNNGTDGGQTSVGTLLIAKGGIASVGAAATTGTIVLANGGAGGTGGTGDSLIVGERGADGWTVSSVGISGKGGNSVYGFGGKPTTGSNSGAGGNSYGAGAGGAAVSSNVNTAGGSGTDGFVEIFEYCNQ